MKWPRELVSRVRERGDVVSQAADCDCPGWSITLSTAPKIRVRFIVRCFTRIGDTIGFAIRAETISHGTFGHGPHAAETCLFRTAVLQVLTRKTACPTGERKQLTIVRRRPAICLLHRLLTIDLRTQS